MLIVSLCGCSEFSHFQRKPSSPHLSVFCLASWGQQCIFHVALQCNCLLGDYLYKVTANSTETAILNIKIQSTINCLFLNIDLFLSHPAASQLLVKPTSVSSAWQVSLSIFCLKSLQTMSCCFQHLTTSLRTIYNYPHRSKVTPRLCLKIGSQINFGSQSSVLDWVHLFQGKWYTPG